MNMVIVTPLISLVLGTIGGGITNYWLRRREDRARVGDAERLAGYRRLVEALDGFIEGNGDEKVAFISEYRKAHLYASLSVLEDIKEFLGVFTSNGDQPPVDVVPVEVAAPLQARILLAMRRDLGFSDGKVDESTFQIPSVRKSN